MAKKRNIIVGQSGGPTSVINSSLAGVKDEGSMGRKLLLYKNKVQYVYCFVCII